MTPNKLFEAAFDYIDKETGEVEQCKARYSPKIAARRMVNTRAFWLCK